MRAREHVVRRIDVANISYSAFVSRALYLWLELRLEELPVFHLQPF